MQNKEKNAGIMEYWNAGILGFLKGTIIPLFQVPKKVTAHKSFMDDNSWPFKRSFLDKCVSRYFGSIKARGPTDDVSEEGTTDPDYKEFLQQDTFQRVQALLKCLDFEKT